MSITTYIQRKFNMAIFKYISRFEDLLEQELKLKNVWTSPNWTAKNFPEKWQTILYSMGCKEDTAIFSVNRTIGNEKYDIVVFSPPKGYDSFTGYFSSREHTWCRHYNRSDYKTDEDFCKDLDKSYQELQNLFTFLKMFEKQLDEMDRVISIQSDQNKELLP